MIVTEQEARKLVCPFSQAFGRPDCTLPHCISTRCMSWEWLEDEYIYPAFTAQQRHWLATFGIMVPEEVRPPFNNGTEQAEAELKSWIDLFGDPQSFNWARVNDTRMLEAGWEFSPHIEEKYRFIGGTQTFTRWRRLNPARKGQCGRTIIVSVERD